MVQRLFFLREPRYLILAWAIYALCALAWLGYREALAGFWCAAS